jgi:hypothetical protein
MNTGAIIQTIIAIIAVLFGYPNLGNVFILVMAPFVLFMLIKQDARYLPALMLHCASDTSIMYLVFFVMMIVCITKTNVLFANKHTRFLMVLLLLTLPLYLVVTYQKMFLDGLTWQGALGYSTFYLSFWAFMYCYLLADTFNKGIVKHLLLSLLIVYLVCRIPAFHHPYRLVSMIVFLGIVYGAFFIFHKKDILFGSIVTIVSLVMFFMRSLTFTELLTPVFALIVFFLWNKNKSNMAQRSVSLLPYIIVIIVMIYGVNTIDTVNIGFAELDISSGWEAITNAAKFKFYGDRVVFWSAAWDQLITLKPLLPMHDIPNITAYSISGNVMDDISFGAHNAPLQLLRIFGFIMGGLLIVCYIFCNMLASKILVQTNVDPSLIPLFTIVFANMILVFWGGTASMLPNYALFTFGLLGVAYGLVECSESQ